MHAPDALEVAVDLENLASGAILIAGWRAQTESRLAAGALPAGTARLLAAVRPVCDLVAEIASLDDEAARMLGALGRVPDDRHARAALQRHLARELLAEPARHAELLTRLLDIGDVSEREGVTLIEIRGPGDGGAGPDSLSVSIAIPLPAAEPSRLTPPAPGYTGRDRELDDVLVAAESGARTAQFTAVTGPAGSGTTQFARVVADRMYQGKSSRLQLELTLTRPEPDSPGGVIARDPGELLSEALLALGIPASDVPADLAERAARYRTALAEAARLRATLPLILLDDARQVSQVTPLRPACPGTVIITGEDLILPAGLEEAVHAELGPLSAADAARLLASRMDSDQPGFGRSAEDLAALPRLVQLCGGVPLALSIMAGVLAAAAASGERLSALAAELERAYSAPADGSGPARAVLAALRVSHTRLSLDQRKVLHAVALLRLPAADLHIIAAAAGLRPALAGPVLEQLAQLSLVEHLGPGGGQWRLHRLVARFVHDLIPQQVLSQREEIIARAAQIYLRRARSLASLLRSPAARSHPAILAWARAQVEAQRPSLAGLLGTALAAGFTAIAHGLALRMIKLLELSGGWPETAGAAGPVLEASRRAQDGSLEARALLLLAERAERQRQRQAARDLYAQAQALARAAREEKLAARIQRAAGRNEQAATSVPAPPARERGGRGRPGYQEGPGGGHEAGGPTRPRPDGGAGGGGGGPTGPGPDGGAGGGPAGPGPEDGPRRGGGGAAGPDGSLSEGPRPGEPTAEPAEGEPTAELTAGEPTPEPADGETPVEPAGGEAPAEPAAGTGLEGSPSRGPARGPASETGTGGRLSGAALGAASPPSRAHAAIAQARGGGQPATETTFGAHWGSA